MACTCDQGKLYKGVEGGALIFTCPKNNGVPDLTPVPIICGKEYELHDGKFVPREQRKN